MALTLEATLYGRNGEASGDRLFGNLNAVKAWADEQGAEAIQVYDSEEDTESYYLKGGAREAWYVSDPRLFHRRMERLREKAQT